MAGLLCLCGNGMSNTTVPSDSIIEIYRPRDIALAIHQETKLIDLWDEKTEYWYCQKCKRVTLIQRKTSKYLCSYSRIHSIPPPKIETLQGFSPLLFWKDDDFYIATEEDWIITVEDFVKQTPSRYEIRLSPDESKAHVFRTDTKEYQCTYVRDPPPDFLKEP